MCWSNGTGQHRRQQEMFPHNFLRLKIRPFVGASVSTYRQAGHNVKNLNALWQLE
jgi:hypothetical protein